MASNHREFTQLLYLLVGKARLQQHLRGVLPQSGRSLRGISRLVGCGDKRALAYGVSAVAVNYGHSGGLHVLIGVDLDS